MKSEVDNNSQDDKHKKQKLEKQTLGKQKLAKALRENLQRRKTPNKSTT